LLENAYLKNIKDALLSDFDKDATNAVEAAKKKLQSEVNQLLDLMTADNLEDDFESFNDAYEGLVVQNNRYIVAVDRAAKNEALYKESINKKAVLRFYKIRCSIAHAGTSSVIFEQMPDSAEAITALLPSVEAIARQSQNRSATV
tara:strand:- start:1121 stop:1555 length:435 start_codon:yes stop_codon:yes gene_type:complete